MDIYLLRLNDDYRDTQAVIISGEIIFEASDLAQDAPEDATLARDMVNGHEVIRFLEKGKLLAGHEWEIHTEDFADYDTYESRKTELEK